MIKCGFFPSKNGDRRYGHNELNKPLYSLISDGVIPDKGNALQVMANNDDTVKVMSGVAHIYGHWMENIGVEVLTVPQSDYIYDRIDRVVIRCDETEDVRDMYIYIKQGRAQTNPVAPTLERTDTIKEMCLAEIFVKKQTNQIKQSNITDTRANTNVCGWVVALIDKVDTSTLYLQWKKAYEDYYAKTQTAIDGWFENIKENLNGIGVLREYRKKIDIAPEETDSFVIDIPMFNPDLDILNVYINGILLNESEYVVGEIKELNRCVVTLNSIVSSTQGDVLELVVMRSVDDMDASIVQRFETELMEQKESAKALQANAKEQQTRLDETLTDAGTAIEAANSAAESANEKASLADDAAAKATEAAESASTATSNANTAADSANDIANEVRRKLEAGELNGRDGRDGQNGQDGADGKDGKDGELGGDTVPIGAMMPCTTDTVPDGWLLCNGSLVSRIDYAELFTIIGESYGAGDGSTTFALPNEPNPLAHTVTDSAIQFVEREPVLYMIIKAKQVVPMAAGLTNDTESNSEEDAFSAAATKKVVQNYVNRVPQKNQLINGGFQVWQRGTSFTSPLGKYTADRCFHNASVADSIKVEKVAEGLKMTALKDCVAVIYRYYAKDTDLARFRKQTMTFSYSIDGVIHSFTQSNFGILFIQNDEILEGYTYDGDYEGLGSCILNVQYSMKAGETKVLNWVKLEYGDVATPFIQNSYEQDLFDCSLYCQSLNIKACVAITNANGNSLSIIVPLYTPINEPITLSGLTYPLKIDFRNNGVIKSVSMANLSNITITGCQAWIDFNLSTAIEKVLIGYIVLNKAILLDAEIYS